VHASATRVTSSPSPNLPPPPFSFPYSRESASSLHRPFLLPLVCLSDTAPTPAALLCLLLLLYLHMLAAT
jgi:hypothetical protein